MSNHYDFSDIAPFDDSEFSAKMNLLVDEPGFEHAVRYVMPDVDFAEFVKTLRSIPDKETFQLKVMYPFLKLLEKKTTTAITCGGLENFEKGQNYTIMSNHRDIVLDASFMNLCLLENGITTSEIAIGSNLLIFDWITDLVKLNKSFIVKRNIERLKALEAARQLSAYIHHAIADKHENVWIAQREGRAKDSNDRTQESLIKMLSLEGDGGSFLANLRQINVMPLSISYEYDPNDYLKAREFLLRRLDPEFKKSPGDDLLAMETGLLQSKGHVHFQFGECINKAIDSMPADMPKVDAVKEVCRVIDCSIHRGYKIYPINYVAFDRMHKTEHFADHYTPQQKQEFENYVESQLDKVNLPDISTLDREYMREMMYVMYANPLRNKLDAEKHC
ncbi:MAG: acyltransferase [Bacteroides sp.]|nr:acyltransferase [Bacteroides sp.]